MRAAACVAQISSLLSFMVATRNLFPSDHDVLINQEAKPEFYEVLNLVIDGKETKVKVQAVQRHPFKPKLTHIDFLRA